MWSNTCSLIVISQSLPVPYSLYFRFVPNLVIQLYPGRFLLTKLSDCRQYFDLLWSFFSQFLQVRIHPISAPITPRSGRKFRPYVALALCDCWWLFALRTDDWQNIMRKIEKLARNWNLETLCCLKFPLIADEISAHYLHCWIVTSVCISIFPDCDFWYRYISLALLHLWHHNTNFYRNFSSLKNKKNKKKINIL